MAKAGIVIYKRCVPGDRLKVEARSNLSNSGGGARDVRLPVRMFKTVIPKVFTKSRTDSAGRQIHSAPVFWSDDGEVQGPIEVQIWPPTKSRSSEMRLRRVHKVTPFDEDHIPAQDLDPFFLIWTDDGDQVWAGYRTVEELRAPGWPEALVGPILDSVERVAAAKNIRGWIDLRTGEGEHRAG